MRKFWKVVRRIISAIVGLLLIDLAVVVFFSVYRPAIVPADDIIILGAAIKTQAAYQRSLEGLRLYQAGLAQGIVVAGGVDYPRSQSEAGYMRDAILYNTSSTPPILIEDKSASTYENLANTLDKIGADKSIIIVSDSYHLARAVLLAKRLGFKKVYWSAPSPSYYSSDELAFYYFREMFAMLDYVPKFVFG